MYYAPLTSATGKTLYHPLSLTLTYSLLCLSLSAHLYSASLSYISLSALPFATAVDKLNAACLPALLPA